MEEIKENSSFKESISLDKTQAAFNKIILDFKRVRKIANILLPLIMITYYIYAIVKNTTELPTLIINIVMLILLLLSYIADRIFDSLDKSKKKRNKQKKKIFSRFIKYLKHLIKFFAIMFAIYEVITETSSTIEIILTIFSVIALLVQILIDVSTLIIEYYINLVKQGIYMDYEEFKSSKICKTIHFFAYHPIDFIKNPPAKILNIINKPLSDIAKKKIGTKTFVNKKPLRKSKKIGKLEKRLYVQAVKDKTQKEEKEVEKKIEKFRKKLEKKKMKKQRISAEFKKFKKSVSILIKKDNDE